MVRAWCRHDRGICDRLGIPGKAGKVDEFLQKYGPEGNWARFFRGSKGYIRTELVRDVSDHLRFLTLDVWKTEEEFSEFRERNLAEYKRLDREFEGLTERETRLGAFWFSKG